MQTHRSKWIGAMLVSLALALSACSQNDAADAQAELEQANAELEAAQAKVEAAEKAQADAQAAKEKAAAQELPEAQYQLAQAYKQGQGTAADPARAETQLRLAAAAGHLPAMLALGIDKNGTAAGRYWLEQAAERGSAEAQYRLGLDYLRGTGGPEDAQSAYVWLSLSLVNGEQRHVAGYMKDFLFQPEQARTPIRNLSGGERARLMLNFGHPDELVILDPQVAEHATPERSQ